MIRGRGASAVNRGNDGDNDDDDEQKGNSVFAVLSVCDPRRFACTRLHSVANDANGPGGARENDATMCRGS